MDCSILVVDYTPQFVVFLSEVLDGHGCSATLCFDGKVALRALEEKSYHLVVSDLKLSQVNGCNIFQKATLLERESMVVLLAGSHIYLKMSSCLPNADDYFVKICDKEEFSMCATGILPCLITHRQNKHTKERTHSLNNRILTMIMQMSFDIRSTLISVNATLKNLLRDVYGKMSTIAGLLFQENFVTGCLQNYAASVAAKKTDHTLFLLLICSVIVCGDG